MKDNIKNIKAIIISITLAIVLLLTSASMLFKLEVLSPTTYTKALEENKIYSEIYEDIYADINKYVADNNLPKGIFANVISKSDVIEVINNDVFSVVGYIKNEIKKIPSINMFEFGTRVEESLNNYIESDAYKAYVSENSSRRNFEKLDVDVIKADILGEIEDRLAIIDNKAISESAGIVTLSKYAKILDNGLVIIGLLVMVFVLCGLYLPIWKRRKKRKFAWIGATVAVSGIILIIVGVIGARTGVAENVASSAPYLATVIGSVIKGLFGKFRIAGASLLVVGTLLASIYFKSKVKRKEDLSLKFG